MFDDKILISKGGIMLLLPASPCLGLMAIGAVAVGAGVYYLVKKVETEGLLDWEE